MRLRAERRFRALEEGALKVCNLELFEQPDPNPGMQANAQASERVGLEQVQLGREQLAQARELGREQLELARPIAGEQAAMMRDARRRGDDQWTQYLGTFKPVEERMAREAMDYDSPAEQDRRATQAATDVNRAYGGVVDSGVRTLTRMGVRPGSPSFMARMGPVATSNVRDVVHAQNMAREGLREKGIALRSGVAAFGRNQPNYAGQSIGIATGAGSNAVNTLNSTVNSTMAAQGTPAQHAALGLQGFGNAANIYMGDYNARTQAHAGTMGAIGTGVGAAAAIL